MREFLLRSGKFEGIHNIYDHPEEFYKSYPGYDLKRWGVELVTKMSKGQWIRAEDDYVVQIMYIKVLVNKSGFTTWFTRFPMGVISSYTLKSGDIRHQQFYGGFTYPNKNSASNKIRDHTRFSGTRLELVYSIFVKLFLEGIHPHKVYRIAFSDYKHYTTPQIDAKIDRLLSKRKVMNEIVSQLGKAKELLREEGITIEAVIKKIKGHWDNVKVGSAAELNAIRFIGPLIDLDFEKKLTKASTDISGAEEADYKEVGNDALPPADITMSETE